MGQTYFDFALDKNLITQDGVITTALFFDIPAKSISDFSIRPVLDNGMVYIYNPATDAWVNGTDLWSTMPDLAENIKIRIAATSEDKVALTFIIKNKFTQKEYATAAKPLWGKKMYKKYIDSVNTSVNAFNAESPAEVLGVDMAQNMEETLSASNSSRTYMLGPILSAVLVFGAVAGLWLIKRKPILTFK